MATITIFKTDLTPEKNALVEDLNDYLGTCTVSYYEAVFQYQKIELDMNIKVNVTQDYVADDYIGNYVRITQDSRNYYFFIMGTRWVSKEAVELQLSLDTVNTFASDLVWTNRTKITRQHKDRFATKTVRKTASGTYNGTPTIALGNPFSIVSSVPEYQNKNTTIIVKPLLNVARIISYSYDNETGILSIDGLATTQATAKVNVKFEYDGVELIRNIDDYDEGIAPIKYHKDDEDIVIRQEIDTDWHLIYANKDAIDPSEYNQVNPVKCLLAPTDSVKLVNLVDLGVYTPAELTAGHRYFLTFKEYPQCTVSYTTNGTDYITESLYGYTACFKLDGGYITYYKGKFEGSDFVPTLKKQKANIQIFKIRGADSLWDCNFDPSGKRYPEYFDANATKVTLQETNTPYEVNVLSDIDRTDSKLIKIIKLPYCPDLLTYNESLEHYSIDSGRWSLNASYNMPELLDLNSQFNYTFKISDSPFDVIFYNPTINVTDSKDIRNESKLFNSFFYTPKFVYDSFGFQFNLEQIDLNKELNKNAFEINYAVTSTMNSRFMFSFPQYNLKKSSEDYSNVLTIARNNELPLYNSAYINYIRNGYNYDVKNKNTTLATNIVKGVVTTAAAIISAFVPGGQGISAAAAVALGASAASTVTSTITTAINQENSIQQKLLESRNQSVSVSGSDDVDLMTYYSGNRAKLCFYKCSDQMKAQLWDLFFKTGYACYENAIPVTDTRYWFNFIQCEPDFNDETTTTYKEFLDDIKARYQSGVTVYHNHSTVWDLEQQYENWESSLL